MTTTARRNVRPLPLALCLMLLPLLPVVLGGCPTSTPTTAPTTQDSLRTTTMQIGGRDFTLEVADTPATRERGLMHRQEMPRDHGMLFVFERQRPLSFWMRNTLIPLDIIYVDALGRVVSVHTMRPLDETSVPSRGLAKYAIELNTGVAEELGVKPGDVLQLPPDARDPTGAGAAGR